VPVGIGRGVEHHQSVDEDPEARLPIAHPPADEPRESSKIFRASRARFSGTAARLHINETQDPATSVYVGRVTVEAIAAARGSWAIGRSGQKEIVRHGHSEIAV
jgi:hypothetical protein